MGVRADLRLPHRSADPCAGTPDPQRHRAGGRPRRLRRLPHSVTQGRLLPLRLRGQAQELRGRGLAAGVPHGAVLRQPGRPDARSGPQPQLRGLLGRCGGLPPVGRRPLPRLGALLRARDPQCALPRLHPAGHGPGDPAHLWRPRGAPAGFQRHPAAAGRTGVPGPERPAGLPQRLPQHPGAGVVRGDRDDGGLVVLGHRRVRPDPGDRPANSPSSLR